MRRFMVYVQLIDVGQGLVAWIDYVILPVKLSKLSLAWPDRFSFSVYLCGGGKKRSGHELPTGVSKCNEAMSRLWRVALYSNEAHRERRLKYFPTMRSLFSNGSFSNWQSGCIIWSSYLRDLCSVLYCVYFVHWWTLLINFYIYIILLLIGNRKDIVL